MSEKKQQLPQNELTPLEQQQELVGNLLTIYLMWVLQTLDEDKKITITNMLNDTWPILQSELPQGNFALENGGIVIKPYNDEKDLVIGCGHSPITNSGGYLHETKEEEQKCHQHHSHVGKYMIDTWVGAKPDCIVNLEKSSLSHIPDNSFKTVIFEGVRLWPTENLFEVLLRVMGDGARCYDYSPNGDVLFYKEGGKLVFPLRSHTFGGYPDFFDWSSLYPCDHSCMCRERKEDLSKQVQCKSDLESDLKLVPIPVTEEGKFDENGGFMVGEDGCWNCTGPLNFDLSCSDCMNDSNHETGGAPVTNDLQFALLVSPEVLEQIRQATIN